MSQLIQFSLSDASVDRVTQRGGRSVQRTSDGRERGPRDWKGRGSDPFVNWVGVGKECVRSGGDGVDEWMSGTAFIPGELAPKMVKQTCDRRPWQVIIDYPAVLTQGLGTAVSLTRPCRCSRQMTQGTRPDSSGSCTRSTRSTVSGWPRTRICTSGRYPTTTCSGRTFGTIPES